MSKDGKTYLPRKVNFMEKIDGLLKEYARVFIVEADNVGSNQMQQIRVALRGHGVLLMGKNTMIRNALRKHMVDKPQLAALKELIVDNIGLVFTHKQIPEVKTLLLSNRVPAAAKVGGIAPIDVIIPAGPTGLDPGQTSFFQALNISTKLSRGEIEILNPYTIVKSGEPVNASAATLLQKLKITPFTYGLEIRSVYDNGTVFEKAAMDLTDDMIAESFFAGLTNVATLSLGINWPTLASLPHSLINGYKNILAVGVQTKYSFAAADKLKNAIANPVAKKEEPKPKKEEKPKEEAKPKEEPKKPKKPEPEPEDDGPMLDLFG